MTSQLQVQKLTKIHSPFAQLFAQPIILIYQHSTVFASEVETWSKFNGYPTSQKSNKFLDLVGISPRTFGIPDRCPNGLSNQLSDNHGIFSLHYFVDESELQLHVSKTWCLVHLTIRLCV